MYIGLGSSVSKGVYEWRSLVYRNVRCKSREWVKVKKKNTQHPRHRSKQINKQTSTV